MYEITLQRGVTPAFLPQSAKFKRWANAALKNKIDAAEITIRIVDKAEISALNATYRHKNKPTNVLSFPLQSEPFLVGDLAICAEVVLEEAQAQAKMPEAHWAHMVVHGILHLLGYDHEQDDQAIQMETEEINILATLGFSNPYQFKQKGENNE